MRGNIKQILENNLMTAEEVADYVDCSPQKVRRLCRNKKLDCVKLGGNYLIDLEDVKILYDFPR